MKGHSKLVYALAVLLALAVHGSMLLLSWGAAPRPMIQSQGQKGVEIRLAAVPASRPQAQSDLEHYEEPTPPVPQAPLPPTTQARPASKPQAKAASEPRPTQAASAVSAETSDSSPSASAPKTAPESLGTLENKSPAYPKLARQRGQEGEVTLKIAVNAKGQAVDIVIINSSGHALLDSAAKNTVKDWKFRPASQNGMAVAGETVVTMEFRLN